MTKPLEIPIDIVHEVMLRVYPSSSNAKVLDEVEPQDGESRWQLVEGEEYEYVFEGDYHFKEHELVRPSKSSSSRGWIKTGIYVGCLPLTVINDAGFEAEISFEVRSVKMDYRTDYKTMLHDITSHFTDLVMMQGAPVTQRFEVDPNENSNTLYQQFAFMKSLVDSEEFEEALNKILYNPIHKWTGTTMEKDICSVKKLGRQELKQIVSHLYSPSLPYYVVFDLNIVGTEDEYKNVKWDIKQMTIDGVLGKGHSSAVPKGVSLAELMKYVIHNHN